jgi:hypothetical protein
MGQLILSCAKTGRAFKSGFRATRADLGYVPPKWKATLLCAVCHRVHEFNFAEAQLCECADDCCRPYGECQNCKIAVFSWDQKNALVLDGTVHRSDDLQW